MTTTDSSTSSGVSGISRPASGRSVTGSGSGSGGGLSFEAHGEHWFALLRLLAVTPFTPKRESYRRQVTPLDSDGDSADGDADSEADAEEWNFDALITDVHLQLDVTDRKKYGAKLFEELHSFQKGASEEDLRRKYYVAGAKAWDVRNLVAAVVQKRDAVAAWIASKATSADLEESTHARQISLGLHWFGLRNMFESATQTGKQRPLNRDVYFDTHSQKWDFGGMIEDIYIHLDRREPARVGDTLLSELARSHPDADRSRFYSEADGKWDIIALVRGVLPMRDPVVREQRLAAAAAAKSSAKALNAKAHSQDNPEAEAQSNGALPHLRTPPSVAKKGGTAETASSPPPRHTGDLNGGSGRSKSRSRRHSSDSASDDGEAAAAGTGATGGAVLAHAFVSPESTSNTSSVNNGSVYNSENHYKEEEQKISTLTRHPDLSLLRRDHEDTAPTDAPAGGVLPDCFSLHHLPRRSSPPSVRSRHSSRRSSLAASVISGSGLTSPTTSDLPVSAQPPPVTGIHALANLMNENDMRASVNSKTSSIAGVAAARSRGTSRDNSQPTPTGNSRSDTKPPLSPPKLDERRKRMQRTPMSAESQMTWPGAASAEDFAQQQQQDGADAKNSSEATTPKPSSVTEARSQGLPTSHPHHPHNVLARIRRKKTPVKRPAGGAGALVAEAAGSRPRNDSLPRYVGGVSKYGTLPGPLDLKTLAPGQSKESAAPASSHGGYPQTFAVESAGAGSSTSNSSSRPKRLAGAGAAARVQQYGTLQRPVTRQARSGSKYGTSGPIDMSAMRRIHKQHQHHQQPVMERSRVLGGLSERDLKKREFGAAQENAKLQRELEKLKRANSLLQQQRTQYSSQLRQAEDRNHKLQSRLQDVVSSRARRAQDKLNFRLVEQLRPLGAAATGGSGQSRGRSVTPSHSNSSSKRGSVVAERDSMRRGRSVGGARNKRKNVPALDLVLPPVTTPFAADGVLDSRTPFSATPSDRDAVSVASKILETYEYQIKELKAENAKLRDDLSAADSRRGRRGDRDPAASRRTPSRSSSTHSAANAETFLSASKTHSRSSSVKSTPPGLGAVSSSGRVRSPVGPSASSAFDYREASKWRAETERHAELVEALRTELRSRKKESNMASEIEKLLTEERNELLQTVERLRAEMDKLKKSGVGTSSGADADAEKHSDKGVAHSSSGENAVVSEDDLKSAGNAEEQGDTTSENAALQQQQQQHLFKEVDMRDVKVENARHAITRLRTELSEVVTDARATQVQLKARLQNEAHSEERVLAARIECDAQKMRFNQLTKSYIDLQALLKSSERKVDALTKENLEIAKREADTDAQLLELRERYGETLEELHEKARALTHATHERYRAVEELRAKTSAFNELSQRHETYRLLHEDDDDDDSGSVSSLEMLPPSPFDGDNDEDYAALTSEEILEQIREVRAKIAAARGDQVDLGALTGHHHDANTSANTNANDTANSSGLSSAFDASFGHASHASSRRSSVGGGDDEDEYGGVQLPPAVQLALLRQLEARIGRPLTDEEISHLRRLHAQLSQSGQGAAMTPEMIHQMVGALETPASAEAAHLHQGADESMSSGRPTSAPPARAGVTTSAMYRRLSIPRRGACGGLTTTCGGGGRRRNVRDADGYVGTTCGRGDNKCIVM